MEEVVVMLWPRGFVLTAQAALLVARWILGEACSGGSLDLGDEEGVEAEGGGFWQSEGGEKRVVVMVEMVVRD